MAHDSAESSDAAPEFPAGLTWFNVAEPLSLKALRGRFVLLNFWTASAINCQHTLPELQQLAEKFHDELTIVGVHAGKFPHEKTDEAIRQDMVRLDIQHPVVNDRDYAIWKAYGVDAWPSLILIDPAGNILGSHTGEGIYDLFDMVMANALKQFDDAGEVKRGDVELVPESLRRSNSLLLYPSKLTVDPKKKRLIICDSGHNRILIVDPDGRIDDVIGCGRPGADDGSFSAATFNCPRGAVLVDDMLYICDTDNHLIRTANFANRQVRTVFGTGSIAETINQGGYGTAVALNSPWDICEADGKLYIAMAGPHQIWEADLNMLRLEPYAGSTEHGRVDGKLLEAKLAQPSGITSDGICLFFVDADTSSVRTAELDPDGEIRSSVGAGAFDFGDTDGSHDLARLQYPTDILAADGKIFVADTYNHKIRQIDPLDQRVSTLAGTGKPGVVDGPGLSAQFREPSGLALLDGILYVADTCNHLVRKIELATGTVSTLTFSNFTAISPDRSHWSGRTLTLPAHRVLTGSSMLTINLQLPTPYELNPDAPVYLDWYPDDDGIVRFSSNAETIDLGPNDSPLRFRVSTFKGETSLHVEAIVYLIRPDHPGCFLDMVRATVPINVGDDGEPGAPIVLPVAGTLEIL